VGGARDADAFCAQALGHQVLNVRRPCVVVLAVADQDRERGDLSQFGGAIGAVEQVPGHRGKSERAAAQRALPEELDDLGWRAFRFRLGTHLAVPDVGDHVAELIDIVARRLEVVEQVAQRPSSHARDGARP